MWYQRTIMRARRLPNSSATRQPHVTPGRRFRPDAAALAAAGALGIVGWSQMAHPWSPSGSGLDATANEWLIWFTVLYLTLAVGGAVAQHTWRALRWRGRGDSTAPAAGAVGASAGDTAPNG
jgi:hypothetical protein